MSDLVSIDEGRRRVLEAVRPLPAEDVGVAAALGRVLSADVRSAIDVPPFDSSALDGYAAVAGPAAELEVVGEARAGHPARERVEPGTAIRISTGAGIPEGATAVVPVERCEPAAERSEPAAVRVDDSRPGANIRRAGEDIRAGELVLRAGSVLG
ncbi:MAG: hypothetical protein ACRDLD_04020, partial [Thermoleophilaceae bacterium]